MPSGAHARRRALTALRRDRSTALIVQCVCTLVQRRWIRSAADHAFRPGRLQQVRRRLHPARATPGPALPSLDVHRCGPTTTAGRVYGRYPFDPFAIVYTALAWHAVGPGLVLLHQVLANGRVAGAISVLAGLGALPEIVSDPKPAVPAGCRGACP